MTSRTVLLSFALGTGHKQVADNLVAELAPLGHACEHRPLEGWAPWEYDLLFRHGYLFLALKHPRVWDSMYHSPRFTRRERLVFPIMQGRISRAFEKEGFGEADLVVATQYNAMEVAADWKLRSRRPLRLAAVITDYDIYPLWARPEVDLFLVPHEEQAGLLQGKGVSRGRIAVTGIPISPEFEKPHDRVKTLSGLGLNAHVPTVLVFGGGGGMGPLNQSVEGCLKAPGWQVVLVCGNNGDLRRALVPLAQAEPERLRVLGYRNDIPALMQACDVVVTKGGGLSLTEALYSKARVVVIQGLPGQEQVNIRFMEGKGWVSFCPRPEDLPGILDGGSGGGTAVPSLPPSPARVAAKALDTLISKGEASP